MPRGNHPRHESSSCLSKDECLLHETLFIVHDYFLRPDCFSNPADGHDPPAIDSNAA
jgi:hypothetical protein